MILKRKSFFRGVLLCLSVLILSGCEGSGTETGDPGLTIEFSAFESSQAQWLNTILPKAFATVGSVRMCIHQIRFKAENNSSNPGENANIKIGLVELNRSGTSLGEINVEPGVYRRIDIMVKDVCDESFALSTSNDTGTFQTMSPKTLRFEGQIEVLETSNRIILNIPTFIDFFNALSSDAELDNGLENIQGTF